MLLNNDKDACCDFIKNNDLSREMIFFVSQMIKLCSQPEQGKCINILGAFIKETDTRYINEHIDRREYE